MTHVVAWNADRQAFKVSPVENIARHVVSDIRATGGSTTSVTGEPTPVNGYMVSLPGNEETFTLWSDETVADYITRHGRELSASGRYVGAWVDDGTLYLDVSVRFASRADADRQARKGHQLAYWDLANSEEIRLVGA